jgi:hypothetical protein
MRRWGVEVPLPVEEIEARLKKERAELERADL